MSNICLDGEKAVMLRSYMNDIRIRGMNSDNVSGIVNELSPRDIDGKLLIGCGINERFGATAQFDFSTRSISLSLKKLGKWLDTNLDDFIKVYNIKDFDTFRAYLFMFVIGHEIEHSYQYLMSTDIIEAPNNFLKNAYKGIFDILKSEDYIIPRPITQTRRITSVLLYKFKEDQYLLERNANIEGADFVSQLALYNNREDIFEIFDNVKKLMMKLGYINSNIGSIEETYRKTLMYRKYKKIYEDLEISDDERIRFGFNISDETRNKLLSKNRINKKLP